VGGESDERGVYQGLDQLSERGVRDSGCRERPELGREWAEGGRNLAEGGTWGADAPAPKTKLAPPQARESRSSLRDSGGIMPGRKRAT
jgi:hypothetical protein